MEKQLVKKRFLANTIFVVIGALLYGILNKVMSGFVLPGADVITIRPQLVIPVSVSLLLGPFAGGAIGLLGNLFGDFIMGFGLRFWPWSIANFFIGFVPGMVCWLGIRSIKFVNEFALVLLFIFLGNVIGLFEGFLVYTFMEQNGGFLSVMNSFYLPALISNTYLLMFFMPPILVMAKYLKLNLETRSMFFVLFFSLVVVTVLSSVLIFIEYNSVFKGITGIGRKALINNVIILNFRWIGLTLLLIVMSGVYIGYYFSRRYMQPFNRLAEASSKLKRGEWSDSDQIDSVSHDDDIGNLIEVFDSMAHEIKIREQKMKNAIRELELKIDKSKEDKIVSGITETDFFKKLEIKSKELREKRK